MLKSLKELALNISEEEYRNSKEFLNILTDIVSGKY